MRPERCAACPRRSPSSRWVPRPSCGSRAEGHEAEILMRVPRVARGRIAVDQVGLVVRSGRRASFRSDATTRRICIAHQRTPMADNPAALTVRREFPRPDSGTVTAFARRRPDGSSTPTVAAARCDWHIRPLTTRRPLLRDGTDRAAAVPATISRPTRRSPMRGPATCWSSRPMPTRRPASPATCCWAWRATPASSRWSPTAWCATSTGSMPWAFRSSRAGCPPTRRTRTARARSACRSRSAGRSSTPAISSSAIRTAWWSSPAPRSEEVAAALDDVAAKEKTMDGWVRDGAKVPPWLEATLAHKGVRYVD